MFRENWRGFFVFVFVFTRENFNFSRQAKRIWLEPWFSCGWSLSGLLLIPIFSLLGVSAASFGYLPKSCLVGWPWASVFVLPALRPGEISFLLITLVAAAVTLISCGQIPRGGNVLVQQFPSLLSKTPFSQVLAAYIVFRCCISFLGLPSLTTRYWVA